MPSKTKLKNAAVAAKSAALPSIAKELRAQFVTGPMTGEEVKAVSMPFKKGAHRASPGGETRPPSGRPDWRGQARQRAISATARAAGPGGRNKAIYLTLGIPPDGTRDILGLWIENTEGATFWMKVFNDLKTQGVADILIAVTDGLKSMPEAPGRATRPPRLSFGHNDFAVPCLRTLLGFASYPILIHRLVISLDASSPRLVALPQLRFASLAVASSPEDFHRQDRASAGRTRKRPRSSAAFANPTATVYFLA